MYWNVGLVFLCVRRLPEVGTPVPKHICVILIINFVLWFVLYCISLRTFVGQRTEKQELFFMRQQRV